MKQVFPMDSRVTYDAEGRPSYDRAVSSKPLRSLIRKLFTTGVMPNPSDTCQVKAGGDGMTLIVNPGLAVLEGGLYLEDAARTLSVTAADPTFDRIDTVVLRWNENDSVRDCDLHVVAGVPAKNPVRPALTREGSIYEIGLADIFVTKGVATITNEKITDTRMESARCGIVSSVSKWDTTSIYQQIQSDLAGFKSNEQAEFMTWFNAMKDQLSEDAAGHLQLEIEDLATTRSKLGAKNLLPYPYYNTTITVNEVTFTDNGDGTITVNGTSAAISPGASSFVFINDKAGVIPAGTYKCTVEGWSGNSAIDWWYIYDRTTRQDIASPSKNAFTYNGMDILYFRYIVRAGKTVSNLTLKPMICLATDHDSTYQPYAMTNKELTDAAAGLFDVVRPVGSLYSTTDANFNPNTAKGWHGTWERIKDCVIYAAGDSDTVGSIVGSNTHTLTIAELPAHKHPIPALSGSTNSAGAHTHNTDWPKWDKLSIHSPDNPVGFMYNGDYDKTGNTSQNGEHEHTVTTNASNTGYTGSGTAIDIRPRRLNSVVWRRTA